MLPITIVVPIILNKINRKLLKGNYEEIGDCKLYKDYITIKAKILFILNEDLIIDD